MELLATYYVSHLLLLRTMGLSSSWQHFSEVFPLQHKRVNWKNGNSALCPINDNLAFRVNLCTNIASVWDNAWEMSVRTPGGVASANL